MWSSSGPVVDGVRATVHHWTTTGPQRAPASAPLPDHHSRSLPARLRRGVRDLPDDPLDLLVDVRVVALLALARRRLLARRYVDRRFGRPSRRLRRSQRWCYLL